MTAEKNGARRLTVFVKTPYETRFGTMTKRVYVDPKSFDTDDQGNLEILLDDHKLSVIPAGEWLTYMFQDDWKSTRFEDQYREPQAPTPFVDHYANARPPVDLQPLIDRIQFNLDWAALVPRWQQYRDGLDAALGLVKQFAEDQGRPVKFGRRS